MMNERVELLIDALDRGAGEFVSAWREMQTTREDLEGLLNELERREMKLAFSRRALLKGTTMLLAGALVLPVTTTPAGAAAITSMSVEEVKDGQTGIEINGSGFGSSQGSGVVRLYAQGRNQPDTSLSQAQDWIEANQTIAVGGDWTDTQITFTCVIPTYDSEDWPAWYILEVTNNDGQPVRFANRVIVGPNQTTSASQDSAGFIPIGTGDDEATIAAAESAGKAYRIATGVHDQWDMDSFQAGDVFVADAGAICDGGDDITASWTDNTGSWSKGSQTQVNANPGATLIDSDAKTDAWNEVNDAQADFYIGLSSQGGPLCRFRMATSAAAIESAGPNDNTLGTDPITTVKDSHYVTITDSNASASGGITFGEAIKLAGCDAVGGIAAADLNGWHTVIYWKTVGTNTFTIRLPTAATSSASGGGASITRTKDVRAYFDSGSDVVHINTDPTATNTVIRRSVKASAFGSRGSNDAGGLHLRGHPESFLEVRHYSSTATAAAISGGNSDAGGWRVQYVFVHHCHGQGLVGRGSNGDYEFWDCKTWFMGRAGFGGNIMPVSFWRRIDSRYNNTAHYSSSESGAGKISACANLDFDQGIMAYNFGQGLWPDINNNTSSDGIRRILCHNNGRRGIYIERNTTLTAQFNVRNCLARDNHWMEWTANWGLRARPDQIQIAETDGTEAFPCIVDNCQIEVPDGQSAEGTFPLAGITVKIKTFPTGATAEPSRYNFFQNCVIVYKGNSAGVPQSGFQFFDNDPVSDADLEATQSTSDFITNTYYYTGDVDTDDVFAYGVDRADWQGVNRTEWVTPSGIVDESHDTDSIFHENQSAAQILKALANWHDDAMPTWNDVLTLSAHNRKARHVVFH